MGMNVGYRRGSREESARLLAEFLNSKFGATATAEDVTSALTANWKRVSLWAHDAHELGSIKGLSNEADSKS